MRHSTLRPGRGLSSFFACGLLTAVAVAQAPEAGLAERLAGTWRAAGSGQAFHFDGERCVVAYGLQQTLMVVRYADADGSILRHRIGHPDEEVASQIEFADSAHATLTGAQQTLELERVAGPGEPVPEEVDIEPMSFGARAVDDEEIATIQAELAERQDREQAVRQEIAEVEAAIQKRYAEEGIAKPAHLDPEMQSVISRMVNIDTENSRYLRALMADVGWIDAERFGDQANLAAFLIVQHCGNLAMLRPVVEAMKAEFDAGHRASGSRYALMYDRLTLSMGGEQRYGSQLYGKPDGSMYFPKLEDPAGVDARRESVGLESLASYAARFSGSGSTVELPDGYEG